MYSKLKLVLAATFALATVPVALLSAQVAQAASGDQMAHREKRHDGGGMGGIFGGAQINLTDAQKTQMKAIAQKHRQNNQGGQMQAQRQQLKTLMAAPTVDANALRNLLNAHAQQMQAQSSHRAAMMSEMRAVLTAEQRAQLVKSLNAAPNRKADKKAPNAAAGQAFRDRMAKDLALTPAQKPAFDALHAKMQAQRAEAMGDMGNKKALAAFIETGNVSAFQASMQNKAHGMLPVNELVAVAQVLNQTQRQKLLNKLGGFGDHGGKGGKGGKGGHGGHRGGHGGHQ